MFNDNEIKKDLAEGIRLSLIGQNGKRSHGDFEAAVKKVEENGFNWCAIYSDGCVADNPTWIWNAQELHGTRPREYRVGTYEEIWA